jgi:hypothetical protein
MSINQCYLSLKIIPVIYNQSEKIKVLKMFYLERRNKNTFVISCLGLLRAMLLYHKIETPRKYYFFTFIFVSCRDENKSDLSFNLSLLNSSVYD